MTSTPVSIAYGGEQSKRSNVLAEMLRSQGHEVVIHEDANGFLSAPEPDLYLIGRTLGDGASGIDLLESLRSTGRSAPVVLVDERPSFQDLRRAIELGATDFVLRPLEAGELAKAIEHACSNRAPRPRIDVEPRAHGCERTYSVDEHTVGRAAREISAFLVNEGVAGAHRVRIASALAEGVDNACRHAYSQPGGRIAVHAQLQGARVQVTIEDFGSGFDVARAKLDRIPAALPGSRSSGRSQGASSTGLGRVERLCESHSVRSGPEGTRLEMTFELTPVRFVEEPENLAETDFLDPSRARSLIASIRNGGPNLSGVAPEMALTIGRILGGIDAEVPVARRK